MKPRRIALGILCLLLVGGVSFVAFQPEPVEAGFTSEEVEDLVEYLESDTSWNLKLMALDALRKKKDTGIEKELETLAKGDDFKLAVAASTALGKKKTSDAKKALKNLLETTSLDTDIRKSAMTAIAVHFKDSSDLTYLESKTASDSDLKGHCKWLKTYIYKK